MVLQNAAACINETAVTYGRLSPFVRRKHEFGVNEKVAVKRCSDGLGQSAQRLLEGLGEEG